MGGNEFKDLVKKCTIWEALPPGFFEVLARIVPAT